MQDVGGCRAVVETLEDLWKLRDHIVKIHPPIGENDYVAKPRSSGYRGVHLILLYGQEQKPVEVQLRTLPMHAWAMLVERYSGAVGVNYKQDGDSEFQQMAQALSQILAADEVGSPVSGELIDTYNILTNVLFPEV